MLPKGNKERSSWVRGEVCRFHSAVLRMQDQPPHKNHRSQFFYSGRAEIDTQFRIPYEHIVSLLPDHAGGLGCVLEISSNNGRTGKVMNRKLTILVAEDTPADVLLLKRALSKANITNPVQVVETGKEAVEYLTGSRKFANRHAYPVPGLLFTDLSMPYMNGFDLLRWLRARPEFSSLPVIVLSSSKVDIDMKQAYQLGADSYLVKPNRFADLVGMVFSAYEYCSCHKQPFLPESC